MQLTDVLTRLDRLVTGAPFSYRAAREPFGFDLQPNQLLDRTYCLQADDTPQIDAYFGFAQAELVPVTLRLARKAGRDPVTTYRTLLTDVSSLASAITRDGVAGDYNADVTSWRVPEPGPDDDFVIAELLVTTDYERSL